VQVGRESAGVESVKGDCEVEGAWRRPP
jgi:hypothetical protein